MSSTDDIAQLRAELETLTKGLDFYRDWQIALFKQLHGQNAEPDLNTLVISGKEWLDLFDEQSTARGKRFFIQEVQKWYALTANDLRDLMTQGNDVAQGISGFLDDFRAHTAFDFYDKAGLFRTTVNKVLKRGKVITEGEWYTLQELQVSGPSSTFTDDEIEKVTELMATYESTK
ncbi:hypothetical protein BVC71_09565 [Marivivens niveibacter]|uniref:Uncharacterized protein n=1 Tax=Marivivens niveibacter TaxID=1930667 RepID=A0A251WX53_9RHOB|nr:hypothetical protein [Marivivens niveibacter]OUD08952.1 hypothetical protein BVC71_09565 [Marivivens niveibacter]